MNVVNIKNKKILSRIDFFIKQMKEKIINNCYKSWGDDLWFIKKRTIKFTKLSENRYHNEKMDIDFIDFAKAYVVHEYPFESDRVVSLIATLRCLEYILIKNFRSGNIYLVNYTVLDEVINYSKHRYSDSYVYQVSRELKKLAAFLYENNMTYMSVGNWSNPFKFKQGRFFSKVENNKKILKEEILYTFADIFSQSLTDKRDIFTTSTFVLLMSAPSRISEVLSLSIDCLFTNSTKNNKQKWGLRFWASKGFGGDIKWIPSVMVPVIQQAVNRIIDITNKPRVFAKLMELDFKSFHKEIKVCLYPENEPLSVIQICEILSDEKLSKKEGEKLLKRLSLNYVDYHYTLRTLWQELQNRLPEGFPWYNKERNIKFSDALFLFFKDTFHSNKSENIIQIYIPTSHLFYKDTAYQIKKENIFERYGYHNYKEIYKDFHSHQIRHLLNTIGQRNGMSEDELAKWSGRASIKQNRVYNHISKEEIIEKYESLKMALTNYTVSEQVTLHDPISREVFLSIDHGAVHKTEFGYCIHDYALSPCQKFRDCLNCSEQICIKDNSDNLTRLNERLSDTNKLIENTLKNSNENDQQLDKDRWLTFHLKNKERLQNLICILESEEIADGSFVRLTNKSYSHLTRIINNIESIEHKKGENNVKKIN